LPVLKNHSKKRETSALIEAMNELNISRSYIVTREKEEEIQTDSGLIEVVPAWKWLLNGEWWDMNQVQVCSNIPCRGG
jgi:predicted AAA+ superfamily ATPase